MKKLLLIAFSVVVLAGLASADVTGIVLDTEDDRVEVTGPTVDGLPFTIDFWLKPGELAADWNEVLGFNTSTGSSRIYLNY